jgi:hypothetical protein
VGVEVCTQQPGAGKLVRVAEGGKLHRRGGKTHFPLSCKQHGGWQEQQHCPVSRSRKASESGCGRKTSQERGKTHLPHEQ